MADRKDFVSHKRLGWHKGFYNDSDTDKALSNIYYDSFFDFPEDEEFPYTSARQLLRGSCHIFALSLKKTLNYSPYIIEGENKTCFHAFCQVYKKGIWFYVDARGITTSFDEFMEVAKEFVTDTYTIRPVCSSDIEEWSREDSYYDYAVAFSESVIEKYKECYTI